MIKNYRKKGVQPMEPWHVDIDMEGVSISDADKANASPRWGDMIAYNVNDHTDKWLVAKDWFLENYEEE